MCDDPSWSTLAIVVSDSIAIIDCSFFLQERKENKNPPKRLNEKMHQFCIRSKTSACFDWLLALSFLVVIFDAKKLSLQQAPSIQGNLTLTPNTPLIHTSFTYRKLNMDEICGLKFYLLCVHTSQKFLLKSLHAQRMSFLVLNLYFWT